MNLLWDFTGLGLSHTGQELCHVVTIGPDWYWNSSQTLKFGHKLETFAIRVKAGLLKCVGVNFTSKAFEAAHE